MEPKLSSEILAYYRQAPERERLQVGVFRLEFLRTKEVIDRWLPKPPAIVLDVGGGPGAYASWLAGRGYEVHLLDPVPELVEQARQADRGITSCGVGDARALNQKDQFADVVLLLGPLYHLIDASERQRALREAHRVLVPVAFCLRPSFHGLPPHSTAWHGISSQILSLSKSWSATLPPASMRTSLGRWSISQPRNFIGPKS